MKTKTSIVFRKPSPEAMAPDTGNSNRPRFFFLPVRAKSSMPLCRGQLTASVLCAAVVMLLATSCNTPPDPKYTKDGRTYGQVQGLFRERWWNFYERGMSFSEGGFWSEAVADFQEALKQRDRDQRRARTYGLHFTDYFPHRDLGIAYYQLGHYEEAQKELELSLAQAETGRAKYYLNEVRRALLKQAGGKAAPPTVSLGVQDGQVTNSFTMKVEGEVKSDAYAGSVVINDVPQFIELSEKKLPFSRRIKLKKGINEIRVKTTDLLGKVAEKKMAVFGDFEGPLMNIKNFTEGQQVGQNKIVLNGTLADSTGVAKLQVNEQVLAYNKEKQLDFTFTVQLKEGPNKIMLAATDSAGNTTSGRMNIVYVPKLARDKQVPAIPVWQRRPIQVALRGSGIVDAGSSYMTAAASPEGARFRVSLKDLTEAQTVLYDSIAVDGAVTAMHAITSVKINGTPLAVLPGRNIFFSQLVDLQEGDNTIVIDVQDAAGNRQSKTITVKRRIPKVQQLASRLSIAIMPFAAAGELSSGAALISEKLQAAFVAQERFNIISPAEIAAALKELGIAPAELTDRGKAVQVGKKLGADCVLLGTTRQTKDGVEAYARLYNTDTGDLFEATDVFSADLSAPRIQYMAAGLAQKFRNSFPLVEGVVAEARGRKIYADFGAAQNIRKDMKFIVYREGEKILHPATGKYLGRDTEELGIATVVNVMADSSVGKLAADFDPATIQARDCIITK